tara:strand:- start:736 stop:1014 length:279 start_codon:yes stop_codon:yes gene_type:complete
MDRIKRSIKLKDYVSCPYNNHLINMKKNINSFNDVFKKMIELNGNIIIERKTSYTIGIYGTFDRRMKYYNKFLNQPHRRHIYKGLDMFIYDY